MKVRNPIEPLTIAPRRSSWLRTLAVCAVASLPWAYAMQQQAERADRLLAEKQASTMRVDRLTIQYASGVKSTIEIKEQQ